MRREHPRYPSPQLYVAGEWIDETTAERGAVLDPASGEVLATFPHATTEVLDRALEGADRGFRIWRDTSPQNRAKIMHEAICILLDRIDFLAEIMTLEQGKPLDQSRAEVQRTAGILSWDAEEALRCYGRLIPGEPNDRKIAVREPVGPVAAFSPWNFPSSSPSRKVGGALAAGCSCIIKPSEETPGSTVELARCFHDAGLPAGVLNVVFGDPSLISEHLIASPVIRKISFTGSTAVGKHLAGLAAKRVLPAVLELGGHAPVIVMDDIDIEPAVQAAVAGKFRNAGQVCVSPTRYYVQERIYSDFVDRFADISSALKTGNGLAPGVDVGPLANERRVAAMEELVADAVDHGARLVCGGKRFGNAGFGYEPTVLAEVPDTAKIMHTEPFGPVACFVPFDGLDAAIDQANRLPYGLCAYAWTQSGNVAHRLSQEIEAGNLSINHYVASTADTPFGGVKESGYGREGGLEGLESYQIVKHVWHKTI